MQDFFHSLNMNTSSSLKDLKHFFHRRLFATQVFWFPSVRRGFCPCSSSYSGLTQTIRLFFFRPRKKKKCARANICLRACVCALNSTDGGGECWRGDARSELKKSRQTHNLEDTKAPHERTPRGDEVKRWGFTREPVRGMCETEGGVFVHLGVDFRTFRASSRDEKSFENKAARLNVRNETPARASCLISIHNADVVRRHARRWNCSFFGVCALLRGERGGDGRWCRRGSEGEAVLASV